MDYEVGQRFRLKQHVGYKNPDELHPDADYERYLDRHYPLFKDQIGTVVEVVPPEVEGAGNSEEEHVVLLFEMRVLVDHNDGDPTHSAVENHPGRTVSFTQAQMDEWFEEVPVGAIEAAMSAPSAPPTNDELVGSPADDQMQGNA